jgi:hypothetical protein
LSAVQREFVRVHCPGVDRILLGDRQEFSDP